MQVSVWSLVKTLKKQTCLLRHHIPQCWLNFQPDTLFDNLTKGAIWISKHNCFLISDFLWNWSNIYFLKTQFVVDISSARLRNSECRCSKSGWKLSSLVWTARKSLSKHNTLPSSTRFGKKMLKPLLSMTHWLVFVKGKKHWFCAQCSECYSLGGVLPFPKLGTGASVFADPWFTSFSLILT